MERQQAHDDLRTLIVMILGLLHKSDERYLLAQQIAKRHGFSELLNDRTGKYEGGDG